MVPLLIVFAAAAGGAAYVATRTQTHTYTVPHLAGLTEAEALNQISGFNWNTVVTREASDTCLRASSSAPSPTRPWRSQEGQPFQLVVSTGPAPRPLPELVGMTLDQATTTLGNLGLVLVQADPAFDEVAPAGTVLSWMVPEQPGLKAGDTVTPHTTVSVVLSAGPQPRVVPNLTGMTIADATAALSAQGLLLAQVDPQFSDTVAAGLIAAQDLAPNTTVDRGVTITVAVSKGPDVVAVPPLANLTLQQATDTLTAAGLTVGTVSGNPAGSARRRPASRRRRAARATVPAWHRDRHHPVLNSFASGLLASVPSSGGGWHGSA